MTSGSASARWTCPRHWRARRRSPGTCLRAGSGLWPLAGFGLLGLISLVIVVASLARIVIARRAYRNAGGFGAAGGWADGSFTAAPPESSMSPDGYLPSPLSAPPPLAAPQPSPPAPVPPSGVALQD